MPPPFYHQPGGMPPQPNPQAPQFRFGGGQVGYGGAQGGLGGFDNSGDFGQEDSGEDYSHGQGANQDSSEEEG